MHARCWMNWTRGRFLLRQCRPPSPSLACCRWGAPERCAELSHFLTCPCSLSILHSPLLCARSAADAVAPPWTALRAPRQPPFFCLWPPSARTVCSITCPAPRCSSAALLPNHRGRRRCSAPPLPERPSPTLTALATTLLRPACGRAAALLGCALAQGHHAAPHPPLPAILRPESALARRLL